MLSHEQGRWSQLCKLSTAIDVRGVMQTASDWTAASAMGWLRLKTCVSGATREDPRRIAHGPHQENTVEEVGTDSVAYDSPRPDQGNWSRRGQINTLNARSRVNSKTDPPDHAGPANTTSPEASSFD